MRIAAVIAISLVTWLVGCAGAMREARSTPVVAPAAAAPATAAPVAPAPAPAPAVEPASPATVERFTAAVAAFDAGNLDEARAGFEAVLEQDGKHAPARFNLGVIAERQGDLAAAERAYRDAMALRPDHLQSLLNLGKVLRRQGRDAEAVPLYESALEARPDDGALLNALAAAQRGAGQPQKAEATARRVLARSREDAEAYRTLALCALDQGNPRLAELYALTARQRAAKDPAVANTLGLVYLRLEDRPRALAELQRALALDPSHAPAHLNLGSLALANRDYVTAEKAFSRAMALEPWSRSTALLRAWALDGLRARDSRRGVDAGAAFEKVLAFTPEDPEATCGAGFGYGADRTGYGRAVPFLEKCLKVAGSSAERQAAEARLKAIQGVLSAAEAEKPIGGSGTLPEQGVEPAPAPQEQDVQMPGGQETR